MDNLVAITGEEIRKDSITAGSRILGFKGSSEKTVFEGSIIFYHLNPWPPDPLVDVSDK